MQRCVPRMPAVIDKGLRRLVRPPDLHQLAPRAVVLAVMRAQAALTFLYLKHLILPTRAAISRADNARMYGAKR
jgi:hypothetical protein